MTRTNKVTLLFLIASVAMLALLPAFASAKRATRGSELTYTKFEKSVALPPTAIQGSAGGDGYDAFFDNAGHVFNIFHHASPAKMDCHTTEGASCGPGWPFSLAPYGSDFYPTGYVDNTAHEIWFPITASSSSGFGCLDISNMATGPAWCGGSSDSGKGYITDGTWSGAGGYDVARLAVDGTRLFTLNANGKLQCLDTSAASGAGAPCSGVATLNVSAPFTEYAGIGVVGPGAPPMLLATGGYVFGSAGTKVFCVKAADMTNCSTGYTYSGTGSDRAMTYLQPSAAGAVEAVCFKTISTTESGSANCWAPDGAATPATVTTNEGLAKALVLASGGDPTWYPQPQTTGTRVYFGDSKAFGGGSTGCFDVATGANCAGWPIAQSSYAITIDPNTAGCVWTNDHSGQIRSFKADGSPGCNGGKATSTAFAPTLPCTGGTIEKWQSFALTAPAISGYTTATLTVTNAAGAVVKSGGKTWSDVKIEGATRTVDLTALAVKDTGTAPTFTVAYGGLTATGDATAELVMGVKGAKGCTNTVPAPPTPRTFRLTGKTTSRQVPAGGTFAMTLQARNAGTAAAKKARIVFRAPKGFVIVSAKGAKVTRRNTLAVWNVGTIKARTTAKRTVVLRALADTSGRKSLGFTVISSLGTETSGATVVFVTAGGGVTG